MFFSIVRNNISKENKICSFLQKSIILEEIEKISSQVYRLNLPLATILETKYFFLTVYFLDGSFAVNGSNIACIFQSKNVCYSTTTVS